MKLKQDTTVFKPITIVLETADEARAFLEIMDEAPGGPEAQELARTLSNAFTSCLVEIPAERENEYHLSV